MPRIGTVIRDVYRRPGAEALPAHLEDRYGIRVVGMAKLDTGVFRVERQDGPPWVARMFLTSRPVARTEGDAEVLRFLGRRQFPAERCAHAEPVSTLNGRAVLVTTHVEEGDDGRGLPEAFLHPDPVRNNVIVTPGGPVLVDWAGAGRGPRLASLAGLLHTVGPEHAGDALAGYRRHTELTTEELGRLEGVLWIRPLWLAAWQCWLACVSPKVSRIFVPNRDYIAALANRVRASVLESA